MFMTAIKDRTRELLRRNLSPHSFNRIRYRWWQASFYLPRLLTSSVVRYPPAVHVVPDGDSSTLARQLRSVNVLAPTQPCRIMTKHGSDKGSGSHNYTTIYAALFAQQRHQANRIFELGLGTNNPSLVSTMGASGRPGASLRGWREFFPKSLVYGADIDRDILFGEDRIATFYCDQRDAAGIRDMWAQVDPSCTGMDVIVDDGLHTFEGNISFLNGSLSRLRPGGFYVVEDICRTEINRWLGKLDAAYLKLFPNHEFAFVELPNPHNPYDNNLLIAHRRR